MQNLTKWAAAEGPLPQSDAYEFREPDISSLLRAISSNFWIICCITLVGVIVAFFAIRAMTPIFTAGTLIMLDTRSTILDEARSTLSGAPIADAYIENEIELIRSDAIIHRVIEREGLIDDPELARSEIPAGIKLIIENTANTDGAAANEISESIHKMQVATAIRKRLDVKRRGLSHGINVSFRSRSQAKARDIANAFAEIYVEDLLNTKLDASRRATEWLQAELDALAVETQEAEEAVENYRVQNTLVGEGEQGIGAQQMRSLTAQLGIARANQSEMQVRMAQMKEFLSSGQSAELLPEIAARSVVSELRAKIGEADREIAELLGLYNVENIDRLPVYQEVLARKRALEISLSAEVARAVKEIETAAAAAKALTQTLTDELQNLRNENATVNAASIGLNELEREAEGKRRRYETLFAEISKADNDSAVQTSHARIVSPATLPLTPSAPRKRAAFAAAVVFSVALGIFTSMVREAMRRGVRFPEEFHGVTNLRPVALMPAVSGGNNALTQSMATIARWPQHPYSDAMRSIRSSLSLDDSPDGCNVIAVTAPTGKDGSAAIAGGLARCLAASGKTTLLVDAEFQRSKILPQLYGRYLGPDFIDVLDGGASWRDALIVGRTPKLAVIGARRRERYGPVSDAFSQHYLRLLKEWRKQFQAIIISAPPVLACADARLVAEHAEHTVLCVGWNSTDRRLVTSAIGLLRELTVTPKPTLTNVPPRQYQHFIGQNRRYFATAVAA